MATTAPTQQKWEVRMHEARRLKNKGCELLFDRVQILVSCYEDEDFRQWCIDQEVNELECLDKELSDTRGDFWTLKAVLEAYPDKESWIKNDLREMIAQIIADSESNDQEDEDRQRRKVNWKERAIEAETECERLRAEVSHLKESLGIVAGTRVA